MTTQTKKTVKNKTITNAEAVSKGANFSLWFLAIAILVAVAVLNNYFPYILSNTIRAVSSLLLVILCVVIAGFTNQGRKLVAFAKESRFEIRKIVWPKRGEVIQTTLIVGAMCVLVALALWGIDSLVVSLITFLTNL